MQVALTAGGDAYIVDAATGAQLRGLAPLVLNAGTDTITLNYLGPDGVTRTIAMSIVSAPQGTVQRAWQGGDLPVVGSYACQVVVARSGDGTFPRTFPDDGTRVTIVVAASLGAGITPGTPVSGAAFYGFQELGGDPHPPAVANYLWLADDGTLHLTVGGSSSEIGAGGLTAVDAGAGITVVTVSGVATVGLGNTAVTPNSYTNLNATIDAHGRITAASDGSGGSGGGGGSGAITADTLNMPVGGDQWGGGSNMPEGVINDYTDPDLLTRSVLIVKGADNSCTALTGIDSTSMPVDQVIFLVNFSISGVDAGICKLFHEDTRSLAANRIQCPGAKPYNIPQYGGVALIRGADSRWHVIGAGTYNDYERICGLHLFPNIIMSPISGAVENWRPTPLTSSVTDLAFWGGSMDSKDYTVLRVQTDIGGAALGGIAGDGSGSDGDGGDPWRQGMVKILLNLGPGVLTLVHLSGGSLATNKFFLPQAVNLPLQPGEGCVMITPLGDTLHDSQWRVFGLGVSNSIFPSVTTAAGLQCKSVVTTPLTTYGSTLTAASAGVIHDLDPGDTGYITRLTAHANGSILGGLVGQSGNPQGERRLIVNIGTGPLILVDEDSGSSSNNQFELTGAPLTIKTRGSMPIFKDGTNKWKLDKQSGELVHITTAALFAGNIDNWDPVDSTTSLDFSYVEWIRLIGSVGSVLRTMNPPVGSSPFGKRFLLTNYGSGMIIKNSSSTGSTGKEFVVSAGDWEASSTMGNGDYLLASLASVWITYDPGSQWIVGA